MSLLESEFSRYNTKNQDSDASVNEVNTDIPFSNAEIDELYALLSEFDHHIDKSEVKWSILHSKTFTKDTDFIESVYVNDFKSAKYEVNVEQDQRSVNDNSYIFELLSEREVFDREDRDW